MAFALDLPSEGFEASLGDWTGGPPTHQPGGPVSLVERVAGGHGGDWCMKVTCDNTPNGVAQASLPVRPIVPTAPRVGAYGTVTVGGWYRVDTDELEDERSINDVSLWLYGYTDAGDVAFFDWIEHTTGAATLVKDEWRPISLSIALTAAITKVEVLALAGSTLYPGRFVRWDDFTYEGATSAEPVAAAGWYVGHPWG